MRWSNNDNGWLNQWIPRINHAHVGIRTCIDTDQSESGYIPGQQATMRYQERELVHN